MFIPGLLLPDVRCVAVTSTQYESHDVNFGNVFLTFVDVNHVLVSQLTSTASAIWQAQVFLQDALLLLAREHQPVLPMFQITPSLSDNLSPSTLSVLLTVAIANPQGAYSDSTKNCHCLKVTLDADLALIAQDQLSITQVLVQLICATR